MMRSLFASLPPLAAPIPLPEQPFVGYIHSYQDEPDLLVRITRITDSGWIETGPLDPDDKDSHDGTIHSQEWADYALAYERMRTPDQLRTFWSEMVDGDHWTH